MENTTDTAVETAPEAIEETTEEVNTEEVAIEEEAQEEVLLAGKYKTPEDLENGYKKMQSLYNSRYKGFKGAPESGEYVTTAAEGIDQSEIESIADTPMFKRLQEQGIEQGMSNDMFNDIVNDYITTSREENARIYDAEIKKLGDDAQTRIDNVVMKLGTILEGDQLDGLKLSLQSAASIEALETILSKDVNAVAPEPNEVDNTDKEAELQELWNAKDSKGRRKMEVDADYRKKVNKKWKDFYE